MIISFSWWIRRFLEKIGFSDWKAFTIENKILKFEEWVMRKPITIAMITMDPNDCNNEWKEMSVSLDAFRLENTSGLWRKRFIFSAKANPT